MHRTFVKKFHAPPGIGALTPNPKENYDVCRNFEHLVISHPKDRDGYLRGTRILEVD